MKLILICTTALLLSHFSFADLASANDEATSDAVESEQIVIDAAADEGAAQDAKQLASHAEEEAREAKRKAREEEKRANSQERIAKRELEKAEAQHLAAQDKIKKWRVEHALWEKKRKKFDDQTAKAKAQQTVTEEKIAAAKQAVAEAHEAADQARRARDEAQRIQAESEAEMKRLSTEVKAAQAEEKQAKQPLDSSTNQAASASPTDAPPAHQQVSQTKKAVRTPSGNLVTLPRDCNLREQASAGSNSLGPVLKGAKLQAKAAGEKWYSVSTDDGKSGFMAAFCFK